MEVKTGYKKTDVGIIPKEWQVLTFGELFDVTAGGDLDPKRSASFRDEIHRYPIYSNALTNRGLYGYCSYADHEAGSITITARGTLGAANFRDHAFTAIGRVLVLRPKHEIAGSYFAEVINSHVTFAIESTGVPQLTAPQISGYKLPVPPLPEQRAIAGVLRDVDALLNALEKLIAKKRDFKQAAMQQLLTGQTRLPGLTGKWKIKRLGECLVSRPDYGINAPAVPFSDRLPSYIRITDISEHGRFFPNPRVSVKAANADQFYLEKGDLVFARTGASVGKSYLYNTHDGELVFAGFLIRVRPNPEMLVPAFLAAYATTRSYWNWVQLMSMRSGQPGINGNEYTQLPIPLPSVPEQTAIATVLSDMDAEIAGLEQRLAKTRALKQGMMQELLTGRTRLI